MILKSWFVLIFAPPGNGKSLEQARMSELVLQEYQKTEKKYPELPHRILMTNQKLNFKEFKLKDFDFSSHVCYWESPEQIRYCPRYDCFKDKELHLNHDVDIFIDEGSTLFPADGWATTPMWLRKMWAQHRHNGIRIVMLTQDFMGIDINCRRMLWDAYFMQKSFGSRDISPTLPPLSRWTLGNFLNLKKSVIWGVYTKRRFDPMVLKNDPMSILKIQVSEKRDKKDGEKNILKELKMIGSPEPHFITFHKINLYDTTQNVKESVPQRELEHIEVRCLHERCGYVHRTHKLK